jgi:hypothetical protein
MYHDFNFVGHLLLLIDYNQRARQQQTSTIESLHRISGHASQFLDAYALPLDGSQHIPTFVRMPTITACSIAVPHGQQTPTGRACSSCQGQPMSGP